MSAVLDTRPDVSRAPMSDRPAGLDPSEELAYRVGHSRAMLAYVRKHGGPGVTGDKESPAPGTPARRALAERVRDGAAAWHGEHGAARDLAAHKAGMSSLRRYWTKHDLADRAVAYGPVKASRKPAARILAAVPDVPEIVAAAVESGRVEIIAVNADPVVRFADVIARRASNKGRNRELAAAMRAAGVAITAASWERAKSAGFGGLA